MTVTPLVLILVIVGSITAAPAVAPTQSNHLQSFELPPRQPYLMEGYQPVPVSSFKRSPFPEYLNAVPVAAPSMSFGPFPTQSFGPRPFEMVPPASNAFYGFRSF